MGLSSALFSRRRSGFLTHASIVALSFGGALLGSAPASFAQVTCNNGASTGPGNIVCTGSGAASTELTVTGGVITPTNPETGILGTNSIGGATVTVSGVTVNSSTSTSNRYGIAATTTGTSTGNVLITGTGTINMGTSTGTSAFALYAHSVTGDTTINFTGDITSGIGNDPSGIRAIAGGSFGGGGSTGKVSVTYNGDIEAQGNNADGIYASAERGAVNITVTGGKITTLNTNGTGVINSGGGSALGIVAQSSYGDVTVTSNATQIETHGAFSSGIYANSAWQGVGTGVGNVKVNNSSSITTKGGGADRASGIQAQTRTGNITVENTGSIRTEGSSIFDHNGGAGIMARAVNIGAPGQGGGNIVITNSGAIETGDVVTGKGAYADGILAFTELGGTIDINNMGTIKTVGTLAHGIFAANGPTAAFTGTGATRITNKGAMTIAAAGANGIQVDRGGVVTINNHNNITVNGGNSRGINARSTGVGDITITHHAGATITTHGDGSGATAYEFAVGGAPGIYVYKTTGSTGNVVVNVDGNITTNGANRTAGVFARNSGTGNATIFATGNINATNAVGPYSYGLTANITGPGAVGDASVYYTNAAGTVSTAGHDSIALYCPIFGSKPSSSDEIGFSQINLAHPLFRDIDLQVYITEQRVCWLDSLKC